MQATTKVTVRDMGGACTCKELVMKTHPVHVLCNLHPDPQATALSDVDQIVVWLGLYREFQVG